MSHEVTDDCPVACFAFNSTCSQATAAAVWHGCMVPATFQSLCQHAVYPGKQPGHGSWLLGLGEAANVQEPARFQPRKESTLSVGPGEWLADVLI